VLTRRRNDLKKADVDFRRYVILGVTTVRLRGSQRRRDRPCCAQRIVTNGGRRPVFAQNHWPRFRGQRGVADVANQARRSCNAITVLR
jgi:hypothetical protein